MAGGRAEAVPRNSPADFAPDRFHFVQIDLRGIGGEIPFVYDVPGEAALAAKEPRTSYDKWIGLGLQALRDRKFNIAADCFQGAIAKTNAAPDAVRHLLARSLLLDGRAREAETVWDELCRRAPGDAEAQWQLGCCLFLRAEPEGAMAHFEKLDALAPAHPYPPLVIGLVDWELRQMTAAERNLLVSTRRNKAPAQAFLAISALAAQNGDVPESLGWLRRAFDRLAPVEQRRWYVRPQFDPLRRSGIPLVAALEREFSLDESAPVEAVQPVAAREAYELAIEHTFGASLDFAPTHENLETNAPPGIEGLQVLRLAPRLVPK